MFIVKLSTLKLVATGIDVHYISPVVCGVCIFYTTIGGLKAVVWTDTIQFTVTVGSIATVFILGTIQLGGLGKVWNKAIEGERLDIFEWVLQKVQNAYYSFVQFWPRSHQAREFLDYFDWVNCSLDGAFHHQSKLCPKVFGSGKFEGFHQVSCFSGLRDY